jgi:tetratricopeptide (TPR) repeat protein
MGGMGVVYRARQDRPQRDIALKVLRPATDTTQAERLRRFEHEAQVLARLEHDGIARIYQAGTAETGQGEQPYFAMELIEGGQPLTAYADAHGLDTPRRVALLIQACQAVQYAHQQGVLHRDLKPANILVETWGQPKVVDFGVARVIDNDLLVSTLHTGAGQLVGTLAYMSPEQADAENPADVDTRSDVYTLGVISYELLAGRMPYDVKGKPALAAARVIRDEKPRSLRSLSKAFSRDLDTILAKALDKDKNRRYQSVSEFAADLQRYLDGKPVEARPAGALYHVWMWARRNRLAAVLAAGLAVALLAGIPLLAWAVIQRDRANLAEKEKAHLEVVAELQEKENTRLKADGFLQDARVAAQRGQWREAVALHDKALVTDPYRESVPVRLDRVRALLGFNEVDRYVSELDALAGTPNLGEYEGSVLLLHGDILLGRDGARAELLIRQALQNKLLPGERAYAQALLAQSTPEAIDFLRRALALDLNQPRARTVLELLLILLAQLPDARSELSAHEALFPEDAHAKVLRVVLEALERKLDTANGVLDGLRGRLAEDDVTTLRALARLLAELRDPANEPDPVLGLPDLSQHLMLLVPLLRHLGQARAAAGPADATAAVRGLLQDFPLPPLVRKTSERFLNAMRDAGGDLISTETIDEFAAVARTHPEGTVLYMHALVLFGSLRFEDAEKAALEAADAPALLPVRRPAYLVASSSEGMQYAALRSAITYARSLGLLAAPHGHGPLLAAFSLAPGTTADPDPALGRRAVANLRRVLALGPVRAPFQLVIAVHLANSTREYNLARQLLDEWQRAAPDDLAALSMRVGTEMQAEAFGPAVQAADEYLRHKPDDEAMQRKRQEAVEKLRQQLRRYAQPPADR